MIAQNLLSSDATPLRTSDTGDQALSLMNLFFVKHLPIVNNEQFLGMVSEDDIYQNDLEAAIGSYTLSLSRPYVRESEHIFEVMSKMAKFNLTVIPVVDEADNYLGLISQDDLLQFYAKSFSFSEPGAILVLETTKPNYSLAEISRIVEQESAVILGTFLTYDDNSNAVYVTLKINKTNIEQIISSFERFDYIITGSFYEEEYFDRFKNRYDSLMNYLNV